jgi:Dullard-like phosphatase family protein
LVSYTTKEDLSISKRSKEFFEVYTKIIKYKKSKKTKETLSIFCSSTNKNLDISIYLIKQFSNNFFKVGYFTPIHNILFDIFLLIDSYTIPDVADIIISGVLYFLIHNTKIDNKNTATIPNMVSIGGTGAIFSMASLGFIEIPPPFLPKLPNNLENTTYTLVLDLDETLAHFFFTPSGGTFLIRPYCFKFLEEMKKIFEIVIFTAATKDYADSILDVIDPDNKYINHRLYRSHTTICNFTFVKDLSKIGRNLNKTIIVDNLADNFKLQPNNGIQIGTWTDDMKDTQLNDLALILQQILEKKPDDVRMIIKKLNEEINKNVKKNLNMNPFKGIDLSKVF